LHLQVVEHERLAERGVRLRLLQREARREEGDQRLIQEELIHELITDSPAEKKAISASHTGHD